MVGAVYPGTFDPITNGHLDIIGRAASLFGNLLVADAADTPKGTLFTADERVEMAREACRAMPQVSVKSFRGLLVDFAKTEGVSVMVRGLRAVSDFEAELQMALMNRALGPELETVFLMTREDHLYLSSSIVKEVAALGGEIGSFVPDLVKQRLRRKLSRK